jgi:biopolymer transport protein ExbB/biopolymer transport protein TolQ
MLVQKLLLAAQSGATVVMYVLIALSVVSVGIIIERWWYFHRRRFNLNKTSAALQGPLRARDVAGAKKALGASRAIEADIMRDALEWFDAGPDSVREILQRGVRERRKSFESGLVFLGTLGNNSPFVGLFGTVLGVVAAFRELGTSQTAMASGGGGMGNVMSAIAEALVATAIGILVALPAVVAYNIYQKKGADIEENTAALGNLMIAAMEANPRGNTESGKKGKLAIETAVDEVKGSRRTAGVEA